MVPEKVIENKSLIHNISEANFKNQKHFFVKCCCGEKIGLDTYRTASTRANGHASRVVWEIPEREIPSRKYDTVRSIPGNIKKKCPKVI